MLNLRYFKDLQITIKFILWFLAIALVPLIIATYISYSSSQRVLVQEVTNTLRAVSDNKANQVEAYLSEKERNVTRLSHTSDTILAMEKFSEAFNIGGVRSPEYEATLQEFGPFLTYYEKSFGYQGLFLVHPDGDMIFSTKGEIALGSLYERALEGDSEIAKVFIKVKNSLKTEISDFEYHPETGKAACFIAAPIFKAGDLVGVVALQMGNEVLYEFAQDYTGLGETGETIIASSIQDQVVFISPLRFDPNAALKRRVSIGSKEETDIQKAVKGEKGFGVSIDYRGKKTLTVRRFLPSFRLGMVVKMDTREVFTSARHLRNRLLRIASGLLIIVAFMAIIIARSVSAPIKKLTEISGTIASGNLSARARIDAKDEIGELAQSFNQMTDSLVEANANIEQKRLELEEQKKLLEKANHELDSFVYTASHDLRAPLRGIDAFATFIEKDYASKLDEDGKNYLGRIRSGVNRMTELIDDLLSLSRISRIKNPFEDVNIGELIESVTERIEFDIKKNNVRLKIAKDLPVVSCDRIKLGEVFLNLINNAIKFSSKNKDVNPEVQVGYNDKSDVYEFYVKDNGIGIDKKYHKEIFGIFKRLHKQEEYEGTGAGLSIVKNVIDDHQGRIWIESELGKGAKFCFTIPKKPVEKKKLGEILIEDGTISERTLKKALKKQDEKDASSS
ncbi:ATP-binding protein [Candidatus Omnitrophota bacterium]